MHPVQDLIELLDLSSWLAIAIRLTLATAAGALIGWERERQKKPAGLRTHMMVSLGAAAFMLATLELNRQLELDAAVIRIDPARTLAGIIGGVGFLGAGTIIEARGSVRGITTAASIWVVASLGVACGMGMYRIAFTTAVLAVMVLTLVGIFEHRAFPGAADDGSGG